MTQAVISPRARLSACRGVLLQAKPVSLLSARDKLPFEITPFMIPLSRVEAPPPVSRSAQGASQSEWTVGRLKAKNAEAFAKAA